MDYDRRSRHLTTRQEQRRADRQRSERERAPENPQQWQPRGHLCVSQSNQVSRTRHRPDMHGHKLTMQRVLGRVAWAGTRKGKRDRIGRSCQIDTILQHACGYTCSKMCWKFEGAYSTLNCITFVGTCWGVSCLCIPYYGAIFFCCVSALYYTHQVSSVFSSAFSLRCGINKKNTPTPWVALERFGAPPQ